MQEVTVVAGMTPERRAANDELRRRAGFLPVAPEGQAQAPAVGQPEGHQVLPAANAGAHQVPAVGEIFDFNAIIRWHHKQRRVTK